MSKKYAFILKKMSIFMNKRLRSWKESKKISVGKLRYIYVKWQNVFIIQATLDKTLYFVTNSLN